MSVLLSNWRMRIACVILVWILMAGILLLSVPMNWLYAEEPSAIHVQRQGEGRMYYRLGFDYVPEDLVVDPFDRGFSVERSYEDLMTQMMSGWTRLATGMSSWVPVYKSLSR